MRQGREERPKQGGALKGHMETYYPVAPSFKKEGLEGDAICGYIMLHPLTVIKQSKCCVGGTFIEVVGQRIQRYVAQFRLLSFPMALHQT